MLKVGDLIKVNSRYSCYDEKEDCNTFIKDIAPFCIIVSVGEHHTSFWCPWNNSILTPRREEGDWCEIISEV